MQNTEKLHIILKAIQSIVITQSIFSKTLPKEAVVAIETYSNALNEFDWQSYIKSELDVIGDKTPSQQLIDNLRDMINDRDSSIMGLQKRLKQTEQDLIVSNGVFSEMCKKMHTINDVKYYRSEIANKDETICNLRAEVKRLQSIIATTAFPKI